MKVAFATNDGIHINEHFGWASSFAVYDVTPDSFSLVEVRSVPNTDDDEEDDKVMRRVDVIRDCCMLNVAAIGGTAAAKVIRARIHPVKSEGDPTIESVLEKLQGVLQGTPPPWLRKLLTKNEAPSGVDV